MLYILKLMNFQHRLSSQEVEPDFKEVFRYAGFAKTKLTDITDSQLKELAEQAVNEISKNMNCRSVYTRFSLEFLGEDTIRFAEKEIKSRDLMRNLHDCHSVYIFAATLGPAVDKAIQRETRLNPAKAVMMQAAGAMFIEQYCEKLIEFLTKEEAAQNNQLKPRYSPGFGDVPLEVQKMFFELLDCTKNLALTLNDSLIMSPEKSVTAFVGICNKNK